MTELGRWQEVGREDKQAIENGRLQWLITVGRVAYTYFNIMVTVCKWLSRGDCEIDFSRPVWIASCTLTSLGVLVACVFSFVTAASVHDLIDDIAVSLLAYRAGETLAVMCIVFDVLSHVSYWTIIVLGVVVHVMMMVGSLIIGVSAVAFNVLAVYLQLKYDLNNLQGLIMLCQSYVKNRFHFKANVAQAYRK